MSRSFADLAGRPAPPLDALALALAAEFGTVDFDAALARLDGLGRELAAALPDPPRDPRAEAAACRAVLAGLHGFTGDRSDYGDPRNSMLDLVLERGTGLPITLSVVYAEVARRADVPLAGVGLPGHFVVGHFRAEPPLLIDPFGDGATVRADQPRELVRPWTPHEIVTRMLNNLVGSYVERGDLTRALRAADLRLLLPGDAATRERHVVERAALLARLN